MTINKFYWIFVSFCRNRRECLMVDSTHPHTEIREAFDECAEKISVSFCIASETEMNGVTLSQIYREKIITISFTFNHSSSSPHILRTQITSFFITVCLDSFSDAKYFVSHGAHCAFGNDAEEKLIQLLISSAKLCQLPTIADGMMMMTNGFAFYSQLFSTVRSFSCFIIVSN